MTTTPQSGSGPTDEEFRKANEWVKAKQAEAEAQRKRDEPKRLPASLPKTSSSRETEEELTLRWEENDRKVKAREDAEKQARAIEEWHSSGTPLRHATFAEEHPGGPEGKPQHAYRELLESAVNGETVLLIGNRGTGKTAMAACLLRDLAFKGKSVLFEEAGDLFAEFRATFGEGEGTEMGLMDHYARQDLLVIDEAQDRGHTGYEDRILTRLVNKRYGAMRATVIITNENREKAAQSLGDSIVSRMHESGKVIECDWPSFRKRAGEEK